ncbi:TIGR03067 domain-containing protein [Mesorhizobium sp. LHD-90]|uniref:TIGR03067 domain-containing protein n=1 Tax=Mesorhizobium sp. LHD-90 TaxID=3071414 RepID=UPI0027E14BDE|nr:TIGR03067 domain-containing protein [Mesorhizobium sp. LHD-90]MDQ6432508.1 TIGR03067 domain-containing protein [Mesorhizobium sp. LHD-90]
MRGFMSSFRSRLAPILLWLVAAATLGLAQPAVAAEELQGTWVATKVVSEGKPAENLVGHRLTFDGANFQIRSSDGKTIFAGTTSVDPAARPASIDFVNTQGDAVGKTWKGIYALDGDTLSICDNSPNLEAGRPTALEAASGSGHALFIFERAKQ